MTSDPLIILRQVLPQEGYSLVKSLLILLSQGLGRGI